MYIPFLVALVGLFRLTIATSSESCTFDEISPSTNLTWCPCANGFFCARLEVPLDYQNPNFSRASIALIKYPAQANSTAGPYQGQILINPGGPGPSGVDEALNNGSTIQSLIGDNFDIIGFDIRGTWLSEPVANCSGNTTPDQSIPLWSRSVPRLTDDFYNGYIQYAKEVGERCQELSGGPTDAGPHMSSAITARDMLSIVNAFAETEDGKRAAKNSSLLSYYGISYGTFIGQVFASMFPERVGNMVLDGNTNPEAVLTDFTSLSIYDLDGVLATFFIYCYEAGLSECPYYTGSTPKDIYQRFNRSFVQLDPRKAEAENWSNATELEAALIELKVGLLAASHDPFSYFGLLPQILLDLESALSGGNLTAWVDQLIPIFGQPGPAGYINPEWTSGVLCSDQNNTYYNKTLQDLAPAIRQLENQSIIGETWSMEALGCTGWSIKASEIFTGPFGGNTTTPILFVGNTYDPATPLENAISSALTYKNAQVLTIDGTGHTSSSTQNECAFAKMAAYFQTTQLPGNDSYCLLETGQFNILLNGTLAENIARAGLSDLVH